MPPVALLILLLIPVLLALLGCNREGAFQRKLITAIEKKCVSQQPCTVRIKDVTDFPWDHMYFFIDDADQQTVERVLGTKAPKLRGGDCEIVFMNGGKIVLFESEPCWDPDKRIPGLSFDFDSPDSKYWRAYGPDAEFTVWKEKLPDGVDYHLNSVKRQGQVVQRNLLSHS